MMRKKYEIGTTKRGGVRPRFFRPRLKKCGPRRPKAPFLKKQGLKKNDEAAFYTWGLRKRLKPRFLHLYLRFFWMELRSRLIHAAIDRSVFNFFWAIPSFFFSLDALQNARG